MSWSAAPARRVTTTVRVNGTIRAHDPAGISWAQDITSDLPDTVTAGGQVAHRTGTIVWATEGVTDRTPSPWYQGPTWIPTVGDPVTIDVSDTVNTYRVFTGVIDTVEGDAFGRRSSRIVAEVKGANRVIRRGAQTQVGALPSGNVGRLATTPVWVISEICRELGYASVPPKPTTSKLILDAPLQGSTYVYHQSGHVNAQLVTSHRPGGETLQPVWASGPDGFGISNAYLQWWPASGQGTGAGAVGVSFLVYQNHTGAATVTTQHGASTDTTTVRVTGTKKVEVSTRTGGTLNPVSTTAVLPSTPGPHRVSVVFRAGSVSIRTTAGATTHTAATPSPAIDLIRFEADASACVAGVQVWHPSTTTDHHAAGWTPTAHYRYGTGTHSTTLAPSIRDEKAGDVLQSYADALLSPLWVDGNGHLQVVTGKGLHDQAPTLVVDALRDASDLSYTMALLDHRPTVEVTYAHAHAHNIGATSPKAMVWQGSGSSVDVDADDQTFINVPGDEEWIGLADPSAATRVTSTNVSSFQSGTGSWWGLSFDGDALSLANTGGSQVVETLTPWAWKVTTSAATGVEAGMVQTTSDGALFSARYRKFDLPIYRARALVKYEDRTVAVATTGASDLDGVLPHDAGKWVTTTYWATQLATWVHSMVGTPTPVLDGLRVRFDPRIEVGTKITVKAQAVFGADFQALVLSVDHDPGTDTTTLVARVTRVVTYAATLDDVDHAHIGQSLATWDTARAGMTLDAVAADPYL